MALVVVVRVICETAATAFAAVTLVSLWGSGWGLLAAIGLMTVVSFVAVGVGPRTLGRQHAYTIGIVSAPVLQAIGILLKPLTRLLILIGNAVTRARASATARSPLRSNCARSSTWRPNVASWKTTSAA